MASSVTFTLVCYVTRFFCTLVTSSHIC